MKLDDESSMLCTFNTPFGKYRFTRLPFGIKSTPEVFQTCMSDLFADVEGVKVIVDDLLMWGKDEDELKTFLGFIQYLGKFMPNMATVSAPLRELLEKTIAWP